LNAKVSSALNIGNSMGDWTVLRPVAERCLQFLNKVNYDNEPFRSFNGLLIAFLFLVG